MGKCNITSQELAEALDITLDQLENYCDFFDSDPDDDWELLLGVHYEYSSHGSRAFSAEGALEICNYLEVNQEERPVFKRFKRWLLQRDRRLKGLLIAKRVQETSSTKGQLVFLNGKAFLAPRACREILGLGKRQDVLNRTFEEIQRSDNTEIEILQINADFFDDDGKQRYFSGSGLASVSHHLGVRLTQKHRQEWVKAVEEYAPKAFAAIEKHEAGRAQRIEKVMEQVRKKAQGRCQLTNRRKSVHKFNLEVHHLFDKHTYPQVADMEANLIAIGSDIHTHFHHWMGGSKVSCTIEDFERYIEEFSHSLFPNDNIEQATKIAIQLSSSKKSVRASL
ncbi:MAG: hypothetical protein WBA43_02390 [Elainellaceae cyanobacterium]|jgi:hypothetical protein